MIPRSPRVRKTALHGQPSVFGSRVIRSADSFSARRLAITLLGLPTYDAPIEVQQSLTPNRTADWLDLFADSLGILARWVLIRLQCWIAQT